MDSDMAFMGLAELGKKVAKRKLSPGEVTRSMLDRTERLDPKLKSYVTVTLPAALDPYGSLLGFRLVGHHFEEALLFRVGVVWQKAADWPVMRPPLAD